MNSRVRLLVFWVLHVGKGSPAQARFFASIRGIWVALFFFIFTNSFVTFANSGDWFENSEPVACSALMTPLEIKTGEEHWLRTPDRFYYQDPEYGFEFLADLNGGTFKLQMTLQYKDAGIRSRYKASDLYQRAFEHFGPGNIQRVESHWSSGDNFARFHQLIRQEAPYRSAVAGTWSGSMLRHLGFSDIKLVELIPNQDTGKNDRVHVIFERPDRGSLKVQRGEEKWIKNDDMFSYTDVDYGFSFFAMMYGEGQVFVSVELLRQDLGARSRFRGWQLYDQMIRHFGVENIKVIEDTYHGSSDNRNQYFTHTANGMSPEDAARNTWSGRRAAEYGFTDVIEVEVKWQDEVYQEGFPRRMGGHHIVHAKFRRPGQ